MTKLLTPYLIAISWWDAMITRPLAARWAARAEEFQPTAGGRHRDHGAVSREDYEWAMAIKRMAARMERSHGWR